MKAIAWIAALNFFLLGLVGCVSGGSQFTVLSIDYPSEASFQSGSQAVLGEISNICKDSGLEERTAMMSAPSPDNPNAVFRTVGDKEPVVWVMIDRTSGNRVEVRLSTLAENQSSDQFRALLSSIESQMMAIAARQGRLLQVERHGMSIFH